MFKYYQFQRYALCLEWEIPLVPVIPLKPEWFFFKGVHCQSIAAWFCKYWTPWQWSCKAFKNVTNIKHMNSTIYFLSVYKGNRWAPMFSLCSISLIYILMYCTLYNPHPKLPVFPAFDRIFNRKDYRENVAILISLFLQNTLQ